MKDKLASFIAVSLKVLTTNQLFGDSSLHTISLIQLWSSLFYLISQLTSWKLLFQSLKTFFITPTKDLVFATILISFSILLQTYTLQTYNVFCVEVCSLIFKYIHEIYANLFGSQERSVKKLAQLILFCGSGAIFILMNCSKNEIYELVTLILLQHFLQEYSNSIIINQFPSNIDDNKSSKFTIIMINNISNIIILPIISLSTLSFTTPTLFSMFSPLINGVMYALSIYFERSYSKFGFSVNRDNNESVYKIAVLATYYLIVGFFIKVEDLGFYNVLFSSIIFFILFYFNIFIWNDIKEWDYIEKLPISKKDLVKYEGGYDNDLVSFIHHLKTNKDAKKIFTLLGINLIFTFLEFIYGCISNSLGLVSDSAHMLFDSSALAIGLYASFISNLKPNIKFSFGYHRCEILSSYINAIFLIFIAIYVFIESLERMFEPPDIKSEKMMVVSILGFLVNILGIVFFHEHSHHHGDDDSGHSHCSHSHKKEKELNHCNHGAMKDCEKSQKNHSIELSEINHGNSEKNTDCKKRHHCHHEKSNDNSVNNTTCKSENALTEKEYLILPMQSDTEKKKPQNCHGHNHDNHHDDKHKHHEHGCHHEEHDHSHDKTHEHNHNHHHHDHNENLQGVFLHILADALGSVGVILSSILIYFKGWNIADPICSSIISIFIFASAIPLFKSGMNVLMQSYPQRYESKFTDILENFKKIPEVEKLKEHHLWAYKNNKLVFAATVLSSVAEKEIRELKKKLTKIVNKHIPNTILIGIQVDKAS